MIRAVDMGSTFALARYAAEKAKPLSDQIPGASLDVSAALDDKWGRHPWAVDIVIHRVLGRDDVPRLGPLVMQKYSLQDTGSVDLAIETLREIIENQTWQLDHSEMDAA